MTSEEISWRVHICSENNFPTAAGLASSAAGYACLGNFQFYLIETHDKQQLWGVSVTFVFSCKVYSLAQLYGIEGDISSIARTGSGSACRSIEGGFVQWISGNKVDGTDSVAQQIVDANHWPNMRVLILVVIPSY